MSRDYLIPRTCYKQTNAFLLRRRRRRSAVSIWNVDPLRSTTLCGIRSARSGLGQKSFRSFLRPTPKVTPRSSIRNVGEARWPRSHRWTDTSSTLPDAAHDSRNQARLVLLSELSLLSACVRLCQLREVHHSLQQSLNPWSRTQSAATDGSNRTGQTGRAKQDGPNTTSTAVCTVAAPAMNARRIERVIPLSLIHI